jgi:hypothetical protein
VCTVEDIRLCCGLVKMRPFLFFSSVVDPGWLIPDPGLEPCKSGSDLKTLVGQAK